jgi:hypothetical protein
MQQNKQLFVWNDPQGNPPPADVVIPRIEGVQRRMEQLDLGFGAHRGVQLP